MRREYYLTLKESCFQTVGLGGNPALAGGTNLDCMAGMEL